MVKENAAAVGFRKNNIWKKVYQYRWIYFLGVPGMLIMFLFNYLPITGLIMAFEDYNPHLGYLNSPWVGFKHFIKLFSDPKFYNMLKNTLIISGMSLMTFPAPIILALILNEVKNATYKKFVQTSIYLPHFLSWTIVVSLTFFLLSSEQGVVNKIAISNGNPVVKYLFDKNYIYWILMLQSVWRGIGWGSIVYLAAISGIDQGMYEAARIDGANKLQQIFKITLPSIMPTVVVMLILKMGSIISVDFEQVLLMTNPSVKSQLEVFEVFIYQNGIERGTTNYSYITAIGMFKSVINTSLVIFTNWITSKKGFEGVL